MNQASEAWSEFKAMDELAGQASVIHRLHPLVKLLVTIVYIAAAVSFPKYNLSGLLVMVLYPVFVFQASLIPIRTCFRKMRVVLPLVCAVGLFNPFFDRAPLFMLGGLAVSGGVVSMLSLMMKGIFSLMASFLLIATTPIESLCQALRQMHVPKILVTLLLLTYRYISVLLEELSVMLDAYHLRAPGQKGIHVSAWGAFLGQLLLRSMDRASALYESMQLRGWSGAFYYVRGGRLTVTSLLYGVFWIALFLLARLVNLSQLLGTLLV
jgi:cobalt/nickel transport system permease protein